MTEDLVRQMIAPQDLRGKIMALKSAFGVTQLIARNALRKFDNDFVKTENYFTDLVAKGELVTE
jgi:hypothetical protein